MLSTPYLDRYEAYLLFELRRARSTFIAYRAKLIRLAEHTGKCFLEDPRDRLLPIDVRNFIMTRLELARDTINQTVSAAKSWDRFWILEGLFSEVGMEKIRVPGEQVEPRPPLTLPQAQALIRHASGAHETRVVGLSLLAGMRPSDAEVADKASFIDGLIRYTTIKTHRRVELPIHPELERVLELILSEQPSNQGLWYPVRQLRERVGFYWTPNSGRRTFCQMLLDADVEVSVVGEMMGHAPRSMTLQRYGRTPLYKKDAAMARLDYGVRFAPQAEQLSLW